MMKIIRRICLVVSIMSMYGCTTIQEPVIESTKSWEGHYYTTNELSNAMKNVKLDDNESIWVISNYTLKRLLKNTGN